MSLSHRQSRFSSTALSFVLLAAFISTMVFNSCVGGKEAQQSRPRWITVEQALKEAKETGKFILVNTRVRGNPSDSLLLNLVSKNALISDYLAKHFLLVNVDEEHNATIEYQGQQVPTKNFVEKVFRAAGTGSANLYTSEKKFVGYMSGYNDPQYVFNVLRYCVDKQYTTQGIRDFIQDCNRQRLGKKLFPWHSYEEGMALAQQSHKKVLINAYGIFSPYCRKMKDNTYVDPTVRDYIDTYFIPIQVDMDAVGPIRYNNRDMHPTDFLIDVLKVVGYPSTLFYDSDGTRLGLVSGDHAPHVFMYILDFYANEHYKNETLDSYLDKRGISDKK